MYLKRIYLDYIIMVASIFASSMLAAAVRTHDLKYRTLYLKRCLKFRTLIITGVTIASLLTIQQSKLKVCPNKNIAFTYLSGFNQKEIIPEMIYI